MVKVGISGFNTLARMLLKVAIDKMAESCSPKDNLLNIVAINCCNTPVDCMAYLIKHDPIYGPNKFEVNYTNKHLIVEGLRISVTDAQPHAAPWKDSQVEYVIDTVNGTTEKSGMHLRDGVKKILVAGNGTGRYPINIFGVNHECLKDKADLILTGSAHMQAVAAITSVLHDNFGVEELINTYYVPGGIESGVEKPCNKVVCKDVFDPMTNAFGPTSSPAKEKYISKIFPELEKKILTYAVQMPLPVIGGVNYIAKLCKCAEREDIICKIKNSCEGTMKGILSQTDDDVRSTDVMGNPYSCQVDLRTLEFDPETKRVHLFGIYDCGYGYASRIYEMANYVAIRQELKNKQCSN